MLNIALLLLAVASSGFVSGAFAPYHNATWVPSVTQNSITGYNVYWRGSPTARNTTRPALLYLPGSAGRTPYLDDPEAIRAAGLRDGFSLALLEQDDTADALLDNFLFIEAITTACWDVDTNDPAADGCRGDSDTASQRHAVKHYRPKQIAAVLDDIQKKYGFDANNLMLSGYSMGSRGSLRFAVTFPDRVRAISISAGILETDETQFMQPTPWYGSSTGESCYDLTKATTDSSCPDSLVVPETLPRARALASIPIRIFGSANDETATWNSTCPIDKHSEFPINTNVTIALTCKRIGTNCDAILASDTKRHDDMDTVGFNVATIKWFLSHKQGSP